MMLEWLIGALLLVTLGAILWTWHKTRAVHLASFEMLNQLRAVRGETDALFAQLQALLALERRLELPRPLPPLRGWAGSPDFLLAVVDEIEQLKPRWVIECSSGVSTIVAARCLQRIGQGHVVSLEHEGEFAAQTRRLLAQQGLADWATVLHAPLGEQGQGPSWYSLEGLPTALSNAELLVIDGPPVSGGTFARAPALARLADRLSPQAVVLLDDAARDAEQAVLQKWREDHPEWQQRMLTAEKGLARLQRQP